MARRQQMIQQTVLAFVDELRSATSEGAILAACRSLLSETADVIYQVLTHAEVARQLSQFSSQVLLMARDDSFQRLEFYATFVVGSVVAFERTACADDDQVARKSAVETMAALVDALGDRVLALDDSRRMEVFASIFKVCEHVFVPVSTDVGGSKSAVVQDLQLAALAALKSVLALFGRLPGESSAVAFACQHFLVLANLAAAHSHDAPLALVNVCWRALRTRAAHLAAPGPTRVDALRALLNALAQHLAAASSTAAADARCERHLKLARFYVATLRDFVALDTSLGTIWTLFACSSVLKLCVKSCSARCSSCCCVRVSSASSIARGAPRWPIHQHRQRASACVWRRQLCAKR
jgi:hypothetical protein